MRYFCRIIEQHIPLRTGITGGIGSGKTTVCRIFETLGIPVYYADARAKWLIENEPALRKAIVQLLGDEAYTPDGAYNRRYVADQVFGNPVKLAALNALVHPAVERDSLAWHESAGVSGAPYTLKEAALMIESGSHRHLDALIVVTAPEEIRIHRVTQRDGSDAESVRARIRNQLPESEKIALADYLIVNDGSRLLLPQVLEIHRHLLARAGGIKNV